ncbi:AMP-binding protein [Corynebacterium ulcerans]|uniref:AMP-binding protein n=1 Tax=Corynebacterium ulcerans TaxID=65058 RepID=UPI0013039996|nr:AMP-binding protein [Corynebacterium ulcerans]MBL4943503.1 AMP-binding protein [Corynebacterium ulcerans]QGZ24709.1 AMP-binding protein [Corynebacterium ulcerans]QOE23422.1 AMP-binding protein [Corynebacterium ulcerans]
MMVEYDYLDTLIDNYLDQDLGLVVAEYPGFQVTMHDLLIGINEAMKCIDEYALSQPRTIVLKGKNSKEILAWIFAAIKRRIPFCIEVDNARQSDSVSLPLSNYGNVLLVELKPGPSGCSLITSKNQGKHTLNGQYAYLVKTSGSTGSPKIIPISRYNLIQMLIAAKGHFSFVPGETWIWEHRPSFDLALWEIFGCILFKGKFIISPTPVAEWSKLEYKNIANFSPQHITLTPSELKKLGRLDDKISERFFREVKSILFCGERLGWDALRYLPNSITPSKVQIYNAYGPSESTIFCSVHLLTNRDMKLSSVPIGKPMGDMSFRINKPDNELCISGPQVFGGYLGNALEKSGEYATGDIVEKTQAGDLIFKGRLSGFLKINGERVDPSRTIAALLLEKEVLDAYLWVVSEPPFDQVLAAIKTDALDSINKRALREAISRAGVYPRPTRYIFLSSDEWPLTDRGKINYSQLYALIDRKNAE